MRARRLGSRDIAACYLLVLTLRCTLGVIAVVALHSLVDRLCLAARDQRGGARPPRSRAGRAR